MQHGHTGRCRGRQRLRGRGAAPPARRASRPRDRRRSPRAAARASRSPRSTRTSPATRRSTAENFQPTDAARLGDAELIFMALPHGESAALAEQLPDARIIDLSADFRLGDEAAWHQFYGDVRYAGRWTYGLPELPGAREQIRAARDGRRARLLRHHVDPRARAAARGGPRRARRHRDRRRLRHLGRRPLAPRRPARQRGHGLHVRLQGRRHPPAHPGDRAGPHRGAQPGPGDGHALLHPDARPDAARHPRHEHGPAHRAGRRDSGDPASALRAAFADAYAAQPVRAPAARRASGRPPRAVYGSNGAHVQVAADPHAGRAVVISTTDNLGKGAAGQAVQIANLMLGLPETAGLTTHGVAP